MAIFKEILNYLSVAALAFMSYGIFKQWWHVYKMRSAKDIVMVEVIIRSLVTALLLIKIIIIGDVYLIIGQIMLMIAITTYFITLLFIKKSNP